MNKKERDAMVSALLAAAILDSEKEATTESETAERDYRKEAAALARPLYEGYIGFIDAGFTPEQAFQLLLTVKGE